MTESIVPATIVNFCDKKLRQSRRKLMRELRVIFSLVTSSKWLLLLRESKKSEQSEDSPSLKWCVTTTKVDPAKGIRTLWDKNHREYRKTLLLKKIFMPLVAKMERSKMANSEEEIKMDIMMYVPQLNFTSKSISFMTESKVGLLTCASFLQ